jgi:ankyrin repeat protein
MNILHQKYGLKLATILLGASCVTAFSSHALSRDSEATLRELWKYLSGTSAQEQRSAIGLTQRLVILEQKTPDNVVNARDANGNTLLHLAGLYGNERVTKILLQRGASTFAKNDAGHTPWDALNEKLEPLRKTEALLLNAAATQPRTPATPITCQQECKFDAPAEYYYEPPAYESSDSAH